MPPFFRFLLLRLISFVLTLFGITVLLYGVIYTFPVEERARLYYPKNPGKNFREESEQILLRDIIDKYGLDQPLLQGRDSIIGPGGNPFGNWWVWLPGTAVLLLYGIGWNLIGDELNDALNPKETREI